MSSSKASGSTSSGQLEIDDVASLMMELGLRKEDLGDVVFFLFLVLSFQFKLAQILESEGSFF